MHLKKLAFSLDLKHADGVLRREVPELAGGQGVPSLSQRADGGLEEKGLEERRADLVRHDGSVTGVFLRSRRVEPSLFCLSAAGR